MSSETLGDGRLHVPPGATGVAGPLPPGARLAIVASRFHSDVVQRLLDGAVDAAHGAGLGAGDIDVLFAAGAFELPVLASGAARSGRYTAVVALACVIRGATPHFEYVCNETWSGLQSVALDTGVPVAAGVLTCDNAEQAWARAGGADGNKGAEAVAAALESAAGLAALRGKADSMAAP